MITADDVLAAFERAAVEVVGEIQESIAFEAIISELGIDSLSFIEMTLVIEDDLGVVLNIEEFDSVVTVNDAVGVVLARAQLS